MMGCAWGFVVVVVVCLFLIQGSDMIRVWKEIWQLLLQQLLLKHCGGGGLVIKPCLTLATTLIVACKAPLSLWFSRQEYWSRLPLYKALISEIKLLLHKSKS